jgi:uncharacterized protein YehS (DUF1456 family)
MPLTNNDTFRRLRYALDLHDPDLEEIFSLSGTVVPRADILNLLKKETDEGYVECSNAVLSSFLDGLIIKRRGKKEGSPRPASHDGQLLSNNDILKKLRIALELHEEDVNAILKKAGVEISRPELSALFRNKDHKNFKECGDQFLRNFLTGLKDYTVPPRS